MSERRALKKKAREMLRKHYALFVIACLIAALVGSSYVYSLSAGTSSRKNETEVVASGSTYIGFPSLNDAVNDLFGIDLNEKIGFDDQGEITHIGKLEFGRSKGVLSSVINRLSNAQWFALIIQAIRSMIHAKSVPADLMILLSSLIVLFIGIFLKQFYSVAYRRIFLESYRYDVTKSSRFLYLFKVKKVTKACLSVFLVNVYQFLWNFTIIGGILARYDYMFIPYIVAENPDIDLKEAIKLSRRMVYGHRFELFRMKWSFLLWMILGRFTLGITDILYTNPYLEATICQYYFKLRQEAKENGVSYAWELNDDYLAEKADYALVENRYADVVEMITNDLDVRDLKHDGLRGFFEDKLGLIYKYDEDEKTYDAAIEETDVIDDYHQILNLRQYPDRLSPLASDLPDKNGDQVHYLRHYPLSSIVLMFFIFSTVGWLYEVLLHIINDGCFVNRGVMHGPWLPIYGSGAVLILMLLFRFRRKPLLEAGLMVLLCGVVEYFGSWFLEFTKGLKWWDYSGYFINLNGRICAEGLLVFMIGGLAAVYLLAPLIDDQLKKIDRRILALICVLLLLMFGYDGYHSIQNPNTGKGITDYGEVSCRIDPIDRQ